MFLDDKTLCQKTQNQVLGRSAGVPCEVASGLRSHTAMVHGIQDEGKGSTDKATPILGKRNKNAGEQINNTSSR